MFVSILNVEQKLNVNVCMFLFAHTFISVLYLFLVVILAYVNKYIIIVVFVSVVIAASAIVIIITAIVVRNGGLDSFSNNSS